MSYDPSFVYDERDRIDTLLEQGEPPLPWVAYDEDAYIEPGKYVVWCSNGIWLANYFDGWVFEEEKFDDGEDVFITHYLDITPPPGRLYSD